MKYKVHNNVDIFVYFDNEPCDTWRFNYSTYQKAIDATIKFYDNWNKLPYIKKIVIGGYSHEKP